MSVSGISSNSFYDASALSVPSRMQQARQAFQQLGQDLQSGDLSAAQADFATLQNLRPQMNSTSSQGNSIAQAFNQLAQDLQSGNLSAAQQDYTSIQQDIQNQSAQPHHHHHHHHGGGGGSQISQLMSQLGQALEAGNLSTAQQEYSSLQQMFQQFGQSNGLAPAVASSKLNSSSVSISA